MLKQIFHPSGYKDLKSDKEARDFVRSRTPSNPSQPEQKLGFTICNTKDQVRQWLLGPAQYARSEKAPAPPPPPASLTTSVPTPMAATKKAASLNPFLNEQAMGSDSRLASAITRISQHLEVTANSRLYQLAGSEDLDAALENTVWYLFDHWYQGGVYVKIAGGKLRLFVPFRNSTFQNSWSHQIFTDPTRYETLDDYFSSRSSTTTTTPLNKDVATWGCDGPILDPFSLRGQDPTADEHLYQLHDMLLSACLERQMPDVELLIQTSHHPALHHDLREPLSFFWELNQPAAATRSGPAATGSDPVPFVSSPNHSRLAQTFLPICSWVSSQGYADLLLPTPADWECATGKRFPWSDGNVTSDSSFILALPGKPWNQRQNVAFFRGTSAGLGCDSASNQRLAVCSASRSLALASQSASQRMIRVLDAAISLVDTRDTFVGTNGAFMNERSSSASSQSSSSSSGTNNNNSNNNGHFAAAYGISRSEDSCVSEDKEGGDDDDAASSRLVAAKGMDWLDANRTVVPTASTGGLVDYLDYKYALSIPSHCADLWYPALMFSGALPLRMQHPHTTGVKGVARSDQTWYSAALQPYRDHVPIQLDGSDLVQQIRWCQEHDPESQAIAKHASRLGSFLFHRNGILDYLQALCSIVSRRQFPQRC